MALSVYPDLRDMAEGRGVCPVCLMGMNENMPKYQCENGHAMCHRCKPYFFGCSVCDGHMQYVHPAETDLMYGGPPPIHYMPHPMNMGSIGMPAPSAPEIDFLENERRAWGPPSPEPNQNLIPCRHSVYGCWIRVPEFLRDLHETRCQFRPFLEVEHLPTDLSPGDELVPCAHAVVGCNVMMPLWRRGIHEPLCIFKERFDALEQGEPADPEPEEEEGGEEDPDELVECKLKIYGCLVKMPRRRKLIHEEKCNYNKFFKPEDFEEPEPEEEEDPESQVECCWAEHGCRIRPKLYRKEIHESKCNYKMEECAYKDNGCEETFLKARKFVHERDCAFKN